MTTFRLEIESGNTGMRTREDVADALRNVADALETLNAGNVRDVNGNTVGEWDAAFPAERLDRHMLELEALGYEGDGLEPLLAVEARAARIAEDYCNVEGFNPLPGQLAVLADVEELFGGDAPEGFFINSDPRGYALKLEEGTGAVTYRDWGDNEILAPDFS